MMRFGRLLALLLGGGYGTLLAVAGHTAFTWEFWYLGIPAFIALGMTSAWIEEKVI